MPYHHFATEERYKIAHIAIAGFSLREIGRRIGRHHTGISREIGDISHILIARRRSPRIM